MSKSPSEKLSVLVALSFVVFFASTYCTAQATETKNLFYRFHQTVDAATNQGTRVLDDSGLPVLSEEHSRHVSTKEPPKSSSVVVTSANHDDSRLPFNVICKMYPYVTTSLPSPVVVKCRSGETPGRDERCRKNANGVQ